MYVQYLKDHAGIKRGAIVKTLRCYARELIKAGVAREVVALEPATPPAAEASKDEWWHKEEEE